MFFNSIKTQFHLMLSKRNFWIAFFLMLFYSLGTYLYYVFHYRNMELSTIHTAGALFIGSNQCIFDNYFRILFPFIVALPFSFSFFDDRQIQCDNFFVTRTNRKQYLFSKAIVNFLGGFFVIFIPFIINLLLNYFTFPDNENTFYGVKFFGSFHNNMLVNGTDTIILPFFRLYLDKLWLYNIFYAIFIALFAGILSLFAFATSFFFKKVKALIFIPVYAVFYITLFIDRYVGTDFDLFNYVMINLSTTRNYCLFFIFVLLLLLYSIAMLQIQSKQDTI